MDKEWIDVMAVDEVSDNACCVFTLDDEEIAVYKLGGEYFAIEDRCTHDGGDLSSGHVEDGCVVCPRHGARFDIRSGRVMAPPAYEDIHAFPTRVEGHMIQILDDRA